MSVAVLTLSFIALDRWYAICHPLLFKSTARRARGSILGIWAVSLAVMVPQAAVMECSSVLPELANRTRLFSVCDEHWAGNGHFWRCIPPGQGIFRVGTPRVGISSSVSISWGSLQTGTTRLGNSRLSLYPRCLCEFSCPQVLLWFMLGQGGIAEADGDLQGELDPCVLRPTDELYPKIYHSCFFIVTYLAPLGLMAMAYFQIFRKLWGRQVRLICCRCLGWEGGSCFSKGVDGP